MAKILVLISCLSLIFPLQNYVYSDETSKTKSEMEMNYRKLLSAEFKDRIDAVHYFYKLRNDSLDKQYVAALVDLFKIEERNKQKVKDFFSGGGTSAKLPKDIAYVNTRPYGLYYLYLCRLISKSADKSLLNLVLRSCMDPESISNFGEDAVEPVVNALKASENPEGKASRIMVLGEMLKAKKTGYVARGDTRNKIKGLLIQFVKDNDRYVRSASVQALGASRDKDVIPIIDDVAKNDPYFYEKKDESTGKTEKVYPVRMKAKEVLENLKKTESEKK